MRHEQRGSQIDLPNNGIKDELLTKLFFTEDRETSEEESAIIMRELQDKFAQYNWFIGLALMGSRLRGYSTEGSDVDLKIFYSKSEISNVALAGLIKKHTKEIEQKHKERTRHITIPYFVGINIDQIRTGIQDVDSRNGLEASLTIKDLSGPATGEKISEVRKKIKDLLSQLDDEKKAAILNKVVDSAVREEKSSERKLMMRLGMTEDDMVGFWEARRGLWTERIHGLWF